MTHRTCLAEATGDGVDLIVPVPSSSRPGRASLEAVDGLGVRSVASVRPGGDLGPAGVRSAPEGAIGPMRPNAGAFAVPDPWRATVGGSRVLLLDDTYVSGARRRAPLPRSGVAAPAPS